MDLTAAGVADIFLSFSDDRGATWSAPKAATDPLLLLENALVLAAAYISWYVAGHAALTSKTAQERLAHALLELAPSIGQKVAGGIELDVTNEELANSVNITPYTTSRMIANWQRSGAVRKRRGKILLRSPEKFFLRVILISEPPLPAPLNYFPRPQTEA